MPAFIVFDIEPYEETPLEDCAVFGSLAAAVDFGLRTGTGDVVLEADPVKGKTRIVAEFGVWEGRRAAFKTGVPVHKETADDVIAVL